VLTATKTADIRTGILVVVHIAYKCQWIVFQKAVIPVYDDVEIIVKIKWNVVTAHMQ